MCLEVRKACQCGKRNVQFHLRDNIMSQEVINRLYCPDCSITVEINPATMLGDNGWIIEYDMELARFQATAKLTMDPDYVQPGYLFDSGYACWLEMYPGEKEEISAERTEILALQKKNPTHYLQEISSWNIARIERLKDAGWRKAGSA